MKKRDLILGIIAAVILAAVGFVATIYYINGDLDGRPEGTELPQASETQIEFEPIPAETQIVFETVEAETEENIPDTADDSPQMDESSIGQVDEVNADGVCEIYDYNTAADSQVYDDLILLAKIVENEAGSNYCTDEHQRAVASVVINRVHDERFPNSVYEVITQGWNGECPIQYAVGGYDRLNAIVPSERALENARYVLENGSTVDNAVWQAEFVQGEIVAVYAYDSSTTYICR